MVDLFYDGMSPEIIKGLMSGEGTVTFSGYSPDDFEIKPGDEVRVFLGGDQECLSFNVGTVKDQSSYCIDENWVGVTHSFTSAGKINHVSHNEAEMKKLGRGRIF
jgi:hypothetical protein